MTCCRTLYHCARNTNWGDRLPVTLTEDEPHAETDNSDAYYPPLESDSPSSDSANLKSTSGEDACDSGHLERSSVEEKSSDETLPQTSETETEMSSLCSK